MHMHATACSGGGGGAGLTEHEKKSIEGVSVNCTKYKRADIGGVVFKAYNSQRVTDNSTCVVLFGLDAKNNELAYYARILYFTTVRPCTHHTCVPVKVARVQFFDEKKAEPDDILSMKADTPCQFIYTAHIAAVPVVALPLGHGVPHTRLEYEAQAQRITTGPFNMMPVFRKSHWTMPERLME